MRQIFLFSVLSFALLVPPSADAAGTNLWKQWYTFTRSGQPAGYYQETLGLSSDGNEYQVQQLLWERRGGGLVNTFLASSAQKNPQLTPTSFYLKRRAPGNLDIVEGIASGTELGIRVHNSIENRIPDTMLVKFQDSTVLGAFAPLRMALSANQAKTGAPLKFSAILEEGNDGKYAASPLVVQSAGRTKEIQGESCTEFNVKFDGIDATWWVAKNGKLCRMVVPSIGSVLELSTEKAAKQFL